MINIFRKIRFNLMENGKTTRPALPVGRYLKYAIGEIILVVIGILIALQINNWNNHRIKKQSARQYIKALYKDFEEIEKTNQKNIDFVKSDSLETGSIIERINSTQNLDTLIKIARYEFDTSFILITNAYSNKTYQSLVSAGNMTIMDDFLQRELVNYNDLSESIIGIGKVSSDLYLDAATEYLNRYSTRYFSPIKGSLQDQLWDNVDAVHLTASFNKLLSSKTMSRGNIAKRLYSINNKIEEIKQYIEVNYSELTN